MLVSSHVMPAVTTAVTAMAATIQPMRFEPFFFGVA